MSSSYVLRFIWAVLAGLIVTLILSIGTDMLLRAAGIFPPLGRPMSNSLFLLATIYRTVYSIAGSYIAARLALEKPMRHALALGAVGLLLGVVGMSQRGTRGRTSAPSGIPLR